MHPILAGRNASERGSATCEDVHRPVARHCRRGTAAPELQPCNAREAARHRSPTAGRRGAGEGRGRRGTFLGCRPACRASPCRSEKAAWSCLGEAGMFSAQRREIPAGLRTGRTSVSACRCFGTDDKQFALNVLRWLSGALEAMRLSPPAARIWREAKRRRHAPCPSRALASLRSRSAGAIPSAHALTASRTSRACGRMLADAAGEDRRADPAHASRRSRPTSSSTSARQARRNSWANSPTIPRPAIQMRIR